MHGGVAVERETNEKKEPTGRKCLTCGNDMEFNPVTDGYFCTVCGRVDKPTVNGYEEDDYLSTGRIIAETTEETDKKCSGCGGVMNYDPHTKSLLCPFCGNAENLNHVSRGYKASENSFEKEKRRASRNWGFKTKTVVCDFCGGKTIYDYLKLSEKCPYCGSNQVTQVKSVETIAPGGVCPFLIEEYKAQKSFKAWIKKRWLCPREAKLNTKLKGMTGIYLPFWTFDTATASPFTATVTKSNKNENNPKSYYFGSSIIEILFGLGLFASENTVTVSGIHRQFFNDILIPASENHDSSILKRLEPYDTDNSLPYSPEFLSGFPAEQYSLGLDEAWETAQQSCTGKLSKSIKIRVNNENYTHSARNVKFKTAFYDVTFKYLLLPVWISSYVYKGEIYQFMVNGCTGKTAGKFPVSKIRLAAAVSLTVTLAALIAYFFLR